MSAREELNIKGSSDLSEEAFPNQYVQEQAEFLENMKKFLLSQQQELRQNLDNVRTKAGKSTSAKKCENRHFERNQISPMLTPNAVQHTEKDVLNGKNLTPTPSKLNEIEIQICPVCGIEFDVGNDLESLETHVAGHWCISETE